MLKTVIGIGGEKAVGKDTAAQLLVEKYGFRRVAFADPLKELCAEVFDMSIYDLHHPMKKERLFPKTFTVNGYYANQLVLAIKKHYALTSEQETQVVNAISGKSFDTPREILQYVGTDVIRKYVKDSFWVDLFHKSIANAEKVVITDMRFPNERVFVRSTLGGKLVRVKRTLPGVKNELSGHASEVSLGRDGEYDIVFQNDGTIKELHNDVEEFYICSVKGLAYTQAKNPLVELFRGGFKTLKSLVQRPSKQ